MKKLLYISELLILSLSFFSCNNNIDTTPEATEQDQTVVIDLRNKTSDGSSYRASSPVYKFSYEYAPTNAEYSVDGVAQEVPQWVIDTIKVEDCNDGVKFVFNKPSETDCPASNVDWFDVHYVDNNGYEATRTSIPQTIREKYNKGETDSLEIVFPLVLPGKTVSLYVQYGYATPNYSEYRVIKLPYIVHTAHGKAMVDDLPKKYDSNGFVKIKNGRYVEIHNIIPPEGNDVQRKIHLWESDPDGIPVNDQIAFESFPVGQSTKEKFTVDLTDFAGIKHSYPYIYIEFLYEYKLSDYPNQTFGTHTFTTKMYNNTIFKGSSLNFLINAGRVEKVSDTEFKTPTKWFKTLLNALKDEGDNFKITLTDTPNVESFFSEICWDDLNDVPNYILDLSKTKLTYIPGWNTGNQIYGGNGNKIAGVILPDTITKIDDGAFAETNIESIDIPASVKWIGMEIIPESNYTNNWTTKIRIPESDKAKWHGLDGGDDSTKQTLLEKWNQRDTEGSYSLGEEGFFQWRRYFRVD